MRRHFFSEKKNTHTNTHTKPVNRTPLPTTTTTTTITTTTITTSEQKRRRPNRSAQQALVFTQTDRPTVTVYNTYRQERNNEPRQEHPKTSRATSTPYPSTQAYGGTTTQKMKKMTKKNTIAATTATATTTTHQNHRKRDRNVRASSKRVSLVPPTRLGMPQEFEWKPIQRRPAV